MFLDAVAMAKDGLHARDVLGIDRENEVTSHKSLGSELWRRESQREMTQ